MRRRRVQVVALQQIYQHVRSLYIPLVYGVLRVHAEHNPTVREAYEWLPPLCIPATTEQLMDSLDEPDVVGFSTYLWNEQGSLALARAIKERWPACLVVFGGPQVPQGPSNYLECHPYIDLLVHGEGEQAFTGILAEYLEAEPAWERVAGLSWRGMAGEQVFSSPGVRLPSLDLPSPFAMGYFDAFVRQGREAGFNLIASLETSRGCPYSCAFCGWGMATKTRPRHRSVEAVQEEFDWVARWQISMMFLIDANFGIAAHDVDLLRYIARLKEQQGYPQSVIVSGFAKNHKERTFEITRILQDHKLDEGITVNFSLQSMSAQTLEAIARQNIPLQGYRELADQYAGHGYQLTPDLIFPLPGETLESFTEGYADLATWAQVNRIRAYPCTILRNTPLAEPAYRARWGIQTQDQVLRLPLLESICPEAPDEFIETVTSTALISSQDAVEARVFVAVVNAFEIYGLTRALRQGLTRLYGLRSVDFYRAWIRWHSRPGALLFSVLADMRASFAEGAPYGEELGWTGRATTRDGQTMMPVKALTFEAVTQGVAFRLDLAAFVATGLGLPGPFSLREADLIRYQVDRWIGPDHDPQVDMAFQYRYDWPTWLQSGPVPPGPDLEALDSLPTHGADLAPSVLAEPAAFSPVRRVHYRTRPELSTTHYVPGRDMWELLFLSRWQPDTFCCHQDSEMEVLEAGKEALA